MSISRQVQAAAVAAGLAVVAVAVGAFVMVGSSKASDVELTTASFVPADAGLYFALNSDLSSKQWVAAFDLIERMGEEDPEGQLKDAAREGGGIDWEDDVAPFLGGNLAFYFRSVGTGFEDFRGAAVIRCKDADRCLEVVLEQGGEGGTRDHSGAEYRELEMGGFVARTGDHLIITNDEESLFEAMDVGAGRKPSLTGVDRFKQLRDELSKDFLGFVYLNNGDLFGQQLAEDAVVKKAIQDSGLAGFALEPVAAVVGAKDAGFEFQEAASGRAGAVSPMFTPKESRFAKLVPANTAMFATTHGLAETWDGAVEAAREQVDEAIRESGEFRDLDDALRAAGAEVGLESVRDLIDLLQGETAFALWYPSNDEDSAEGVFLAEVQDEAKARDVMAKLTAAGGSRPQTEKVGGADVTTVTPDDGDDVSYAVTGGYLAVGSPAGVRAVLQPSGPRLADLDKYRRTVEAVPSSLGTYAYFDLAGMLRLTTGGVADELDAATAALDGLILNMVNERDVARFNGILTVAK